MSSPEDIKTYLNHQDKYGHPDFPLLPELPDVQLGRLTVYDLNGFVFARDATTGRTTVKLPEPAAGGGLQLYLGSNKTLFLADSTTLSDAYNLNRLMRRRRSILIGPGATVGLPDNVEENSDTVNDDAIVCVGAGAKCTTGGHQTVIGPDAQADAKGGTAVGRDSFADGPGATAVGDGAKAIGENSVAIGGYTGSIPASVVTPGTSEDPRCVAYAAGSVQLGVGRNTTANSLQFRGFQMCDGSGNIPVERITAALAAAGLDATALAAWLKAQLQGYELIPDDEEPGGL